MLDLSSFWNISNLSIFIMAGGGIHPARNPWSRSLKSFQHKIVHLMSKNSKLSTWCQKSSKLSTWYQKIQNCSPDVHNTEILGAYNQSRHTTWTVIPIDDSKVSCMCNFAFRSFSNIEHLLHHTEPKHSYTPLDTSNLTNIHTHYRYALRNLLQLSRDNSGQQQILTDTKRHQKTSQNDIWCQHEPPYILEQYFWVSEDVWCWCRLVSVSICCCTELSWDYWRMFLRA